MQKGLPAPGGAFLFVALLLSAACGGATSSGDGGEDGWGRPCTVVFDCPWGLACVGGRCLPPVDAGADADEDGDGESDGADLPDEAEAESGGDGELDGADLPDDSSAEADAEADGTGTCGPVDPGPVKRFRTAAPAARVRPPRRPLPQPAGIRPNRPGRRAPRGPHHPRLRPPGRPRQSRLRQAVGRRQSPRRH